MIGGHVATFLHPLLNVEDSLSFMPGDFALLRGFLHVEGLLLRLVELRLHALAQEPPEVRGPQQVSGSSEYLTLL